VPAVDLELSFRRGEEMRTEISAKFTWARLERDLLAAGLELERWFTDPDRRFAVTLARRTWTAPEPSV
jgi:L-histidine Nalpha-methyltransferase